MAHAAALAALATVKFTKKGLEQLSAREFIEAGFELVLSVLLAVSFFECPDESRRDEQELQTLYTMAWPPAILSALIVYGRRVSKKYGPSPENFERNLRRCKVFTWIYTLAFLIWDPDMVFKRGPALHVAVIFAVCDVVRFELEVSGLMESSDDDDEIERLAAAVDALETDQHHQQSHYATSGAGSKLELSSRGGNALDSISSSSLDSLRFDPQKPPKTLERQSTESLSHEFVELTTPAPASTGESASASTAPSAVGTGAETTATTSHSVNSSDASHKPRGGVFEF